MTTKNGNIIFSYGSSHPELGKKIADYLRQGNGLITSEFASGEKYARFDPNLRKRQVFILQTGISYDESPKENALHRYRSINDHLVELGLEIQAAKLAHATDVCAVVPHFFYDRQDRKSRPREPISAKLVADWLTQAGASMVMIVDPHFEQIQGFFDTNKTSVDILPTTQIFTLKIREIIGDQKDRYVVVSPDNGAAKKLRKVAKAVGIGFAVIDKEREDVHNDCKSYDLMGADVDGRICLVPDDIIDTGVTQIRTGNLLEEHGANGMIVFASHALLSRDAVDKLEQSDMINQVIVTDSVPLRRESKKIRVISIANYLGRAIESVSSDDGSVSQLFSEESARNYIEL
jgi:ribose-phosphate pyrophosphokinase